MIDPRLRVLQMIHHHGTVTAAAAALHYTPSAVSYQIKQLEEEHGVELLEQAGRGIRLSTSAHVLLHHADILFAQAELARSELAATGDDHGGQFSLCGFSTAASQLLPEAAALVRDSNPHLTVRVVEAEPARCYDLLLAEEADLALVTATADTPPTTDPRFDQRPLLDDPLDLIVPAEHPMAEEDSVDLASAAQEDWIVGRLGSAYHQLVLSACMSAGFSPSIAHWADEWETGTALVSHGFGIMLVPRLARLNPLWNVVRVPLRGEPTPARRILAATRSGGRENPLVVQAMSRVTETARALSPSVRPL